MHYPASFDEIPQWARENGFPTEVARVRFAQFVVLSCIAGSRWLRNLLVFKGGNALDFLWSPNRSTKDLDFSIDLHGEITTITAETLRDYFVSSFNTARVQYGVLLGLNSLQQRPLGANRTFITYACRIAYALSDEPRLARRMESGETISQTIPVDISVNEVICSTTQVDLGQHRFLRVSTLEDIVAEKLRALLQQPKRNRYREQDLLDIAVAYRRHPDLDWTAVADYLVRKAGARGIRVTRAAFHDEEVVGRARLNYAQLEASTRREFLTFEEAQSTLFAIVERLPIPA